MSAAAPMFQFVSQGDEIRITGPREKLQLLAQKIEFLAEQEPSASKIAPHLHIDYPGHFYLNPKPTSLVVTRSD